MHVLTHEASATPTPPACSEPAAALAGAYWRNIYPLMPGGDRSGDCRPGGPLDEGLVDAPWFASVSS